MSYLIEQDYLPSIQVGNKAAMTQNNPAIQAKAELSAQAEAISFLKQKYDTSQEFSDTMIWRAAGPATFPGRPVLTAAAWVTLTTYAIGAQVNQGGNIYQCTIANKDASFTVGNWQLLGASGTIPYYATDRVYLTATAYSASSTYAVGVLALESGNVYRCNTAITIAEPFTVSKWDLLGAQFTIFYAAFPQPLFNISKGAYKTGDKVFWKNKIYTCVTSSIFFDHESQLQYHLIENIPYQNVFPDDPVDGANAWGVGIPYTVPQSTDILDTTFWTLGDNRDQQMVQKLAIITIYHLSLNISPRNVPPDIVKAYMGSDEHVAPGVGGTIYPVYSALGWLQACARGEVMPSLPVLQPPKGKRVRYGGPVKNVNSF